MFLEIPLLHPDSTRPLPDQLEVERGPASDGGNARTRGPSRTGNPKSYYNVPRGGERKGQNEPAAGHKGGEAELEDDGDHSKFERPVCAKVSSGL